MARRRLHGDRLPDAPDPRRDLFRRRDGHAHQGLVRHGAEAGRLQPPRPFRGDGDRHRAGVPHDAADRRLRREHLLAHRCGAACSTGCCRRTSGSASTGAARPGCRTCRFRSKTASAAPAATKSDLDRIDRAVCAPQPSRLPTPSPKAIAGLGRHGAGRSGGVAICPHGPQKARRPVGLARQRGYSPCREFLAEVEEVSMTRWLVLFGCAFAFAVAAPMGFQARGDGEVQAVRWHDHERQEGQVEVQGEAGMRSSTVQQQGHLLTSCRLGRRRPR